jgi:hypothetical protein
MIPGSKGHDFMLARNFAWLAGKNMTLGPAKLLKERPIGRISNDYECVAFIRICEMCETHEEHMRST